MNGCNGQHVNTFVQQQKIEIKSIEDSLMCSGKAGASLPCIFFVLHLCYHEHEKWKEIQKKNIAKNNESGG